MNRQKIESPDGRRCLVLPTGEISTILGDECDPDNIQAAPNEPGSYYALWLAGGFTQDQFEAMKRNPRIYVRTEPFTPAWSAATHCVTFAVLQEGYHAV